jgi:O-antigen/teichoic acid export membrane protein
MLLTQGLVIALTLPASMLVARLLGPEELGRFLTAQRICWIAILVLHLSAAHGFSYFSADTTETVRLRSVTGSALLFTAVVAPVAMLAAIGFARVQGDRGLILLMGTMAAYLPAFLLAQLLSAIMRGQLRTGQFNVVRICQPLFWLIFVVCLFVSADRDPAPLAVLFVIGHWSAALVALYLVIRNGWRPCRPDGATGEVLGYSMRAHFGQAGGELNVYLDQVILSFMLPFRSVGMYGVAANTAAAVSGASGSLLPIVQPLVQRAPADERRRTSLILIVLGAAALGVLVVALFIPMPWLIELVYGPQYTQAASVARILMAGVWLDAIGSLAGAVLFGINRPGLTSWAAGAAIATGIVLLLALVPMNGIEGAGWASVGSYLVGTSIKLGAVVRLLWRWEQLEPAPPA